MRTGRSLVAGLLVVGACSGDSVDPRVPTTVTLSVTEITFTSLDDTHDVSATVRDQGGSPVIDAQVTRSSDAPEVADVSEQGVVTARGNGEATITARSGDASGTVDVEVEQVPVSLELSPDPLVLQPLASETVVVTMLDEGGSPVTNVGIVSVDLADFELMSTEGRFAVLWHEIGHVMGIGGPVGGARAERRRRRPAGLYGHACEHRVRPHRG